MADTPQNAYPTTLTGFELPAQQDVNQQPSSGLSFAISGRMPCGLTRKDAVALLQKRGHTHAASITKHTHYLIWDGATAGNKLAQALRYRTPCWTPPSFLRCRSGPNCPAVRIRPFWPKPCG